MNEPIGVVTHYFDHAQAAIIKLSSRLKVGDKIKIVKGENEVEQTVSSMEKDRQPVEVAEVGDEVGLAVGEKVKEGARVYLAKE